MGKVCSNPVLLIMIWRLNINILFLGGCKCCHGFEKGLVHSGARTQACTESTWVCE